MNIKEIENFVRESFEQTFTGEENDSIDDQEIVDFLRSNPEPSDQLVHDFAKKMDVDKEELENRIYKLLSDIVNNKKEPSPKVDVGDNEKEKVAGGKGDNKSDEEFDPEQLRKGIKVESEHTNDPEIAKEIAKDHLTEDPNYYVKLDKIEPENKKLNESIEDIEFNSYEQNLLSSYRDPYVKALISNALTKKGMEKALDFIEKEKYVENPRNAQILDGVIDKLSNTISMSENKKVISIKEGDTPEQIKQRQEKPTQEISPIKTNQLKSKHSAKKEWAKSSFIPLSQVQLIISQDLAKFGNEIAKDTLEKLAATLLRDANAEAIERDKRARGEIPSQKEPKLSPEQIKQRQERPTVPIEPIKKNVKEEVEPEEQNEKDVEKTFRSVNHILAKKFPKIYNRVRRNQQADFDTSIGMSVMPGTKYYKPIMDYFREEFEREGLNFEEEVLKALKENPEMESKNIREVVEKVIKEFCDSKKIGLKEMFDFEKEQGSVVEQEEEQVPPEESTSSDQSQELLMFIENDADLYRQKYLPMIKNLVTKKAQGKYDPEKAIKLFMYLADAGAQKYAKEMGDRSMPWNKMFSKNDRLQTAKELRDKFQQEVEDKAYDYDEMLPKKYKGTELKEDETLQEVWNKKSQKVGQLLLEKMGIKKSSYYSGKPSEDEGERQASLAPWEKKRNYSKEDEGERLAQLSPEEKGEHIDEAVMTDEEIDKIYFSGGEGEEMEERTRLMPDEEIKESTPPGREEQVKALKKELPKTYVDKKTGKRKESSPWAVSWSSYKKSKE